MYSFSDNYNLRLYYLQEQQVPTPCVIKRKMTSNLAAVLFKFLNPKLKVLAGLEPPLKGGGRDWYVCPNEILVENRTVLKPLAHEIITKINHFGIEHLGLQILVAKHKNLQKEVTAILRESNNIWKNTVETFCQEQWINNVHLQTKNNTDHIKYMFDLFSAMYRSSLNNIEVVFHEVLLNDIKTLLQETRIRMKNRYDILCKSQALLITHEATVKLKQEKARLKAKFIENLETCRTEMTDRLHDLKLDKHVVSGKLQTFFEYQKLACQVYVHLKEKEECFKETVERTQEHKRVVKNLTKASALLNFKASIAEQKESIRQRNNSVWLQKISRVVKNFQMLISYCLNLLPDHAEFFINMEKLMLLQVSEALEDPSAESIISVGQERLHSPVPEPKPFYLFCDRGYKAKVDQDLCSKHSGTSTASELPVIIINKRCLYAACDNFEQFSNKMNEFIHGNGGDDDDINDDLVYEQFVPVKVTSSQQISEIKLESSLLQVLQHDISDLKKMSLAHEKPHCCGTSAEDAKKTMKSNEKSSEHKVPLVPAQLKNNLAGPSENISQLEHIREPKLEKFMRYSKPQVCGCTKRCKKHLVDHLPAYMRTMSKFDAVELPNYETCSITALKKLVKDARSQKSPTSVIKISSKTKDMSTQYSDEQFNFLCTCFSDNNISLELGRTDNHFSLESVSPSFMTTTQTSFAIDRAHSLKQLIKDAPELLEIFNKENG